MIYKCLFIFAFNIFLYMHLCVYVYKYKLNMRSAQTYTVLCKHKLLFRMRLIAINRLTVLDMRCDFLFSVTKNVFLFRLR